MTTHTRYFRWDDASAPVLSGTAGSLLAIIRACLVGTAGVAYGSGGTAKASAGWTEEFTGTNVAVFRNSLAAGGTGCYLRVSDTGAELGGAQNAWFVVYGAMTDIDTGTDPAPNPSTCANGDYLKKSKTTDSTTRPWLISADERTVYINLLPNVTTTSGAWDRNDGIAWFGDYESHVPGNTWAYGCGARTGRNTAVDENNSGSTLLWPASWFNASTMAATLTAGPWVARSYTLASGGVSTSIWAPTLGTAIGNDRVIGGANSMTNPSAGGAEEYWMPAYLVTTGTILGRLRGLYVPICNMSAVSSGAARTAISTLPAGAEVVVFRAACAGGINSPVAGALGVETALEW